MPICSVPIISAVVCILVPALTGATPEVLVNLRVLAWALLSVVTRFEPTTVHGLDVSVNALIGSVDRLPVSTINNPGEELSVVSKFASLDILSGPPKIAFVLKTVASCVKGTLPFL